MQHTGEERSLERILRTVHRAADGLDTLPGVFTTMIAATASGVSGLIDGAGGRIQPTALHDAMTYGGPLALSLVTAYGAVRIRSEEGGAPEDMLSGAVTGAVVGGAVGTGVCAASYWATYTIARAMYL